MTLAKIENGETTRYNVSEKQARVGLINFEGDYLAAGFYPQVGSPSLAVDITLGKNHEQ